MELDRIDREIIEILQRDGRCPYTEIAKQLRISEGTVRKRVARLTESQVIQIVGLIDPGRLGFDAPAIIGVSVDPPQLEAAAKQIATFPEVSYLIMVSGLFDLIVEVLCKDRADLVQFLNKKLHQVPGVNSTQTFLTLQTYKMAYGARPMVNE
jgi:Lrp/AsnC family transcriptional regulator for asnA, asnC and gidA